MDQKQIIESIFGVRRALVGMIHVQALPGTPNSRYSVDEICDQAVRSAEQLRDAGFHGLMIENMHDRPYLKREVGPEIVASMAAIGREVRRVASLPLGVQILGRVGQQREPSERPDQMELLRDRHVIEELGQRLDRVLARPSPAHRGPAAWRRRWTRRNSRSCQPRHPALSCPSSRQVR